MRSARKYEFRAGVVVLLAVAGYLGMVSLAGGGPGFMASRRTIDVVFRDGQGIRVGSPVRVAGIDAGRVTGVDLAEVEGILRARVRLTVPADLAARLKQDLKVTIQASLTGTPCVNIVSSGRSEVALVPGQLVQGVESSFLDPVLEQVGLGPVERSHLSHTIAEVRETVDAAGPKVRLVMGELEEAMAGLHETSEKVRPAIESVVGRVDQMAKAFEEARLDQTVQRVGHVVAEAEGVMAANRATLEETLVNIRDLSGGVKELLATEGPKVDTLLEGLNGTRVRADHFLGQASVVATQGAEVLTQNRANLDRSMSNVKEATDFGVQLVQKLYGNPFYLSPFYKPTKEDIQAQEVYDVANTFMVGAKELSDAVTKLEAIRSTKPLPQMTAEEQKYYNQLFQRAWTLQTQLEAANRQLVEGLKQSTKR